MTPIISKIVDIKARKIEAGPIKKLIKYIQSRIRLPSFKNSPDIIDNIRYTINPKIIGKIAIKPRIDPYKVHLLL